MQKISIRICLFNCLLDISEPNTWKIESKHNGCFSSFPKYRFLWYYLTRQKLWLLWGWALYAGMAAKYCSPPPADPQKLINSNFRNWISTCSWKMKSRRRAGLLPPENVVSTNRSSSKVSQGPFAFIDPDTLNSLVQGGRGWLAFSHRKIIPQSFRRARSRNFLRQNIVCLYDQGETGNLCLSRDFHTHRHVPSEDPDLSVTAAFAVAHLLVSQELLGEQ